ncbi:hypothetical protein F4809DRAFT_587021 [Biscogniauxia mediterranea]|nr:hypothetical protein F4809DRAFT_587021 [Biscogniauxia mediterranea]
MCTSLDDNMDYTSYSANDFGMPSYIAHDSMASDDGTTLNGSSQTNKRRRGALDDNTSRKRSKTDEDPIVASEETSEMTYAFEDEIIGSEVVDMIREGASSSSRKDNASEYRKQYKRVIKYLYDDMVESVEGCLGKEEADALKSSPWMLLDEEEDEDEVEVDDDDDDDDSLTDLDVDVDDLVWPDTYGGESMEQMAELASFAGILSCDELTGLVTGGHADDDIEALRAAYGI